LAPQFTWIQYLAARNILAQRLADPNKLFWSDAELGLYIIESLRTFNALTEFWNADFDFNANWASVWYNTGTMTGSPRQRSVTDSDLYTMMQYHLLEAPTGGGTWTGTSQFSLADLQGALQRRRDEVIQVSGCNLSLVPPYNSTPNTFQIILSDNTLEAVRMRFIPDSSAINYGPPVTLTREDRRAFDAFEPDHLQTDAVPSSWSIVTGPPLQFDVDTAPNFPGTYELIALLSGQIFSPPTRTLLNVPDDWSWVCKWGALSDLLSRESEATDRPRAAFCLQRYLDGLKAMRASNWILAAEINGAPVDTPSVGEMDAFSPEWQENETWPSVVVAGIDYVAPCPVNKSGQISGVEVTVVGNAPIPSLDTDYLQVARDTFDAILSYAQVLATFKMGGSDFTESLQLLAEFANAVELQNSRIAGMALFSDVLRSQGKRQDRWQDKIQ
jgi:hypothetical protein